VDGNFESIFFERDNENIFRRRLDIKTKGEIGLKLEVLRYLPLFVRLSKNTIFHSSYYRVSLQKSIINITTVHDFTYEYYRHGISKIIHHWQKYFSIKNSDGIICVSQNTKNDLLKFFPFVDEEKVKVIYNGVSDDFFPISAVQNLLAESFNELLGKKFIIFVGDRISYKNFPIVVDALNELINFNLVVVGGKTFSEDEKKMMKKIESRVYHYQGISSQNLNILYSAAHCLVYPSSYEGFGIPVVEAMRAGCPVITTQYSSLPEVAGDAGLFIKTLSANEIRDKILSLNVPETKEKFVSLGLKQSAKFSWGKCAEETFQFYKDIYIKIKS
jgi:mannosyltransferase